MKQRKKKPQPLDLPAIKVLDAINKAGLPFIITGGAAIALHGIPRSTIDIDIIVPASHGIVSTLLNTVARFYLASEEKDLVAFDSTPRLIEGRWMMFKDADHGVFIDVLFENIDTFSNLQKRASIITYPVTNLDDLEEMKERPPDRFGRHRIHTGEETAA